ncbi:MAG: dephospho-CoA kinase [Parvularculaceae bacterium]
MKKVALTGSIVMGKTTVAGMFADLGAPVWDADAAVRRLYAPGGAAVAPIAEAFPQAIVEGGVDRTQLSALVVGDRGAFERLEAIVHPLVADDRAAAMASAEASGAKAMIFDIPLLFETGAAAAFDVVVVVSAPADVQRDRVLARANMTPSKFAAILARQTPDAEKRVLADVVIDTGGSLDATRAQVTDVWRSVIDAEDV